MGTGLTRSLAHLSTAVLVAQEAGSAKLVLRRSGVQHARELFALASSDDANASSWSLNGNHDMHAGKVLFRNVLANLRFTRQRGSNGEPTSLMHLRGDLWQVVGLYTSWKFDLFDIGGLHGRLGAEQASWHAG